MEEKKIELRVDKEDVPKRLDMFLVEKLPEGFSRSHVQRLIKGAYILVNGAPAKSHHKVASGDIIKVLVPQARASTLTAEKIPLDIVYEDKELLVVNKPAGMVVHPAPGNYSKTLVNALMAHCKDLSGVGGVLKPGIVHRIDKDTTGLLIVAKTDRSHNDLARQFKDRTTRRIYIALAKGIVELDNGIIDLPIGRSKRDRKKMAVDLESAKNAVTQYKVLQRFKDFTMLEVTLGTGRTHQIRVHMAYIGHPLLGDVKYGSRSGIARTALHAKTLGFIHPVTKKYMEFTSKLPKDMKALMLRPFGKLRVEP